MSDYRRKHEHPDGALLSVSLFRGSYHVAAKGHYIGGFGKRHGTHAFKTGVRVGSYAQRLEWVEWASQLPPQDLPTDDIGQALDTIEVSLLRDARLEKNAQSY
jgi:hypothetical protein